MSEYTVERIPGKVRIDPDAAGKERQRKREGKPGKRGRDSVTISEEARRRSDRESGESGGDAGG